jgi:hypothetical protein
MPLVVPGINSKDSSSDNTTSNVVIPTQEQVDAGVFDKNPKALPEHFTAAPGPVIPDDTSVLGKKASREELLARAKELNKD